MGYAGGNALVCGHRTGSALRRVHYPGNPAGTQLFYAGRFFPAFCFCRNHTTTAGVGPVGAGVGLSMPTMPRFGSV